MTTNLLKLTKCTFSKRNCFFVAFFLQKSLGAPGVHPCCISSKPLTSQLYFVTVHFIVFFRSIISVTYINIIIYKPMVPPPHSRLIFKNATGLTQVFRRCCPAIMKLSFGNAMALQTRECMICRKIKQIIFENCVSTKNSLAPD